MRMPLVSAPRSSRLSLAALSRPARAGPGLAREDGEDHRRCSRPADPPTRSRASSPRSSRRSSASSSSSRTRAAPPAPSARRAVAQAPADGYTFGVVFDTHGVNPSVIPNMPVRHDEGPGLGDADRHLAHGDRGARGPALQGLQGRARGRQGEAGQRGASARSAPAASATSRWRRSATSSASSSTHVPYKGGGPLMTDAVGGQVPLAIGTVFLVNPHVKGGKVRALARHLRQALAADARRGHRRRPGRARLLRARRGGASSRRPGRRPRSSSACTRSSRRR